MSDAQISPLAEVANWAKDARDEDSKRYFYHFSDVSLIERGSKNYVIGRKGTGKTAIAEYIRLNNTGLSRLLSFKNFPFNLLYNSSDGAYTAPNQYITIWEYVIYTCVCNMMSGNSRINYDAQEKLRKLFDFDIENALPNAIRRLTDRGFGINLFGIGGNIAARTGHNVAEIPISTRKDVVEKFIADNIDDSNYYILFDALDEDYKDILQPDRKQGYFDLLVGLFKAAQNVRFALRGQVAANIVPVIFLRDEIFDLCRDPDKNKWLDRAILLNWSPTQLQSLIAFRLSRALDPRGEAIPFATIWPRFLRSLQYRGRSKRRPEELFKVMLRSTFNRPRDMINYVRECADVAVNLGEPLVTNEMLREADAQQSNYMRREVIDEVYSVVDDISEILDMLWKWGSQFFQFASSNGSTRNTLSRQGKPEASTPRHC